MVEFFVANESVVGSNPIVRSMNDYNIEYSPYAAKVLSQMADELRKEREKYPHMTDAEFKKHVMDSIEWKEL